ncbi:MAG TPA: VOC family protein [Bryobacteraceae bacterium]|nr:VOC family protein [Bryobacteraceae bacterium]
MRLKQTRLVTKDVLGLAQFYEAITGVNRAPGGPVYVEFQAPCDGLAIAGEAVQDAYGSDVVATAANRSAILDFEVEDVDREYHRLRNTVKDWVLTPTDQPWGTRAILFRDPDGNLINFFAPIRAATPA